MAIQEVKVMRVKVDPNPRGSATTHVTMPSANPFERETLSVRPANQPVEMLPGMGEDPYAMDYGAFSQYEASLTPQAGGGVIATDPAARAAEVESGDSSWWGDWGGAVKNIFGAAVDVGASAATAEVQARQQAEIIKQQQAASQQTAMMTLLANRAQPIPTSSPTVMPAVNPTITYMPAPAPGGMSKAIPVAIGVAVLVGVGAMFMMKGGGSRRRR